MNYMKVNLDICLIFIFLIFFCGCQKNINDEINSKYNVVLPFLLYSDNVVKQNDNYIVLKLTPINKQKLFDLFRNNKNYTTWQELTGVGIFLDGLNVSGAYIFCEAKNVSCTQIKKVFMHKNKSEVIFVNMDWAGL